MKVSECTQFNCCWYECNEKKCFLSGQHIKHKHNCIRYNSQKKRLSKVWRGKENETRHSKGTNYTEL